RTGWAKFPSPRRGSLQLAEPVSELRCRRRLRRTDHGHLAGRYPRLPEGPKGRSGATAMSTISTTTQTSDIPRQTGFSSSRRWLLWSGIALLCAWVLVPVYLVALGALGGRQGVFQWPKTGLPTNVSLEPFLLFLRTEGVFQSFLNSLGAAGITV